MAEIDRKLSPYTMPPAEFLWLLRLMKLTRKDFAFQIGLTPRTIYNEMQREFVRERWAEILENTFGTKRFRLLRKAYRKETEKSAKKVARPQYK